MHLRIRMIKIHKITIATEYLDESTGEIFTDTREFLDDSIKTSKKKSSSSKSSSAKIDDSNPNPTLTLEDNKYILNAAAIEALGVTPGESTIDIKNQKIGNRKVKVIGSSETFGTKAGNKLTLKGTVSFRGKSNEELSQLGYIFTLEPHPNVDGLFILKGNEQDEIEEIVPEEEIEVEDIELEDALEITEDDFNFTF